MKQTTALLQLQLKRAIKNFPHLLLCSIAIAVVVVVVVVFSVITQNQKSPIMKKTVALVVGDNNEIILTVGMNAFENMDTAASMFELLVMEEEEAVEGFESGEIDGVVLFPDGYVDGFTKGDNAAAKLYINNTGKTYSVDVIANVADVASHFIAINEAVSYAMRDMFAEFGYRDVDNELSDGLDVITTRVVLSRDNHFKKTTVVGEDESSMVQDYACAALVMLVLLWGLSCGSLLKRDGLVMTRKLKADGVSVFKQEAIRFVSLFALLELMMLFVIAALFAAYFFAQEQFELLDIYSTSQILFLVPATIVPVMFTTSMVMFCFIAASNQIGGLLLLFTITVAGGYASGCIVSSVYLPGAVRNISGYLPMAQMHNATKMALGYTYSVRDALILGVWTVLLFALCVAINGKRGASE